MTTQMKGTSTHALIVQGDLDHIREEAQRIRLELEQASTEQDIAFSVEDAAEALLALAAIVDADAPWLDMLVRGTFEDLIRCLRRTLEQVDPRVVG